MKSLRTPDARFASLPGYDFAPHYVEVPDGEGGTLRMHYVDEGPRDGAVVLLLHGEPSWSYLYRKMVPGLVAAGLRAVAPDLVGFGRSDKPTQRSDYTYARHVEWVRACIEKIGLRDMTLFAQDWGSLIGLRLVAEHPEAFARVVISNGGLPTGDQQMPDAFLAWRKFSQETEVFDVGRIVARACATAPTAEVIAAYDAPFPDDTYKAGARQFPALVPASADDPATPANRAAWQALARWNKPFLTAFGDKDPITRGADKVMQQMIPGAKGQPHTTVQGGGHFIQEDRGEELAEIVARFVRG
jgi:haloalkane dehalogenase